MTVNPHSAIRIPQSAIVLALLACLLVLPRPATAQLTVYPTTATLAPYATPQFTATPAAGVTWYATGGTEVEPNLGLYTAGPTAGTYTVTAYSAYGTGMATVTITTGGGGALTIYPTTASVALGGTQQFTATPAAGVTWTANVGTITTTGLYIAPTTAGTYTVTAYSAYGSATATVTVGTGGGALTITPTSASARPGRHLSVYRHPRGRGQLDGQCRHGHRQWALYRPEHGRYLHGHRHQYLRHRHRRGRPWVPPKR